MRRNGTDAQQRCAGRGTPKTSAPRGAPDELREPPGGQLAAMAARRAKPGAPKRGAQTNRGRGRPRSRPARPRRSRSVTPATPFSGMLTSSSHRWRTRRDSPLPSAPEHEGDRPVGGGQVPQAGGRVAVEADDPHAPARELLQGGGQAADDGEPQVLDGPGRRLGDRGRDVHGPVAGQHDPGGAGALGRAQQRAEVAGIGDAVDRHEERRPRPAAAGQVLERASRRAAPPWPARPGAPRSGPRRRTWPGRPTAPAPARPRPARRCRPARRTGPARRAARPPAPGAGRASSSSRTAWRPSTWSPPRPWRLPVGRAWRAAAALLARAARPRAGRPRPPLGTRPGVGERRVGALGRPARFLVPLRGGLAISAAISPTRHEGDGEAGDALAPAERTEALGPLALDGDRRADGVAEALLHLGAPRRELRRLQHDGAVDVAGRPARRSHGRRRPGAAARCCRRRRSAGSVSGKCWPMSPSPAAPRSASVTAWATASASLWPASPVPPSKVTPPSTRRRAGSSLKGWTSKPWPTRTVSGTGAPPG